MYLPPSSIFHLPSDVVPKLLCFNRQTGIEREAAHMRKLLAVVFTAALIMLASVSVSWGNDATFEGGTWEGGTWEGLDLGGTWE